MYRSDTKNVYTESLLGFDTSKCQEKQLKGYYIENITSCTLNNDSNIIHLNDKKELWLIAIISAKLG